MSSISPEGVTFLSRCCSIVKAICDVNDGLMMCFPGEQDHSWSIALCLIRERKMYRTVFGYKSRGRGGGVGGEERGKERGRDTCTNRQRPVHAHTCILLII